MTSVSLVASSFIVFFFGDCTAQLKIDAVKTKNNNVTFKGKPIFYVALLRRR
jgi:hypothetical protein